MPTTPAIPWPPAKSPANSLKPRRSCARFSSVPEFDEQFRQDTSDFDPCFELSANNAYIGSTPCPNFPDLGSPDHGGSLSRFDLPCEDCRRRYACSQRAGTGFAADGGGSVSFCPKCSISNPKLAS